MTIHICLASSDNYVKYMATTMASVLCNTERNVHFYIFSNNISEESKAKLNELKKIKDCAIDIIVVNEELFKDCPAGRHTNVTYYRYMSSSIKVDKILYLDSDVIVEQNIDELWDTELEGFYLAGITDNSAEKLQIGTDPSTYINAGVLLINSALWRADNIEQSLFRYTEEFAETLRCADQNVINAVCHEKIKLLPTKWNHQHKRVKSKDARIYHFIGPLKPWHAHSNNINKKLYWKYSNMTPWAQDYTFGIKLWQGFHTIRLKIKEFLKGLIKHPKKSKGLP